MSKTLVAVSAAILAAALAAPAAAQAGHHGGKSSSFAKFNHHHHHRRIVIVPVYTETYRVRPMPVVKQTAAATVRYADGMGRVYDASSGVWSDGQSHCWAGKSPWTFKSGSWFYGSYRWNPSGDSWLTNAPEPPASVDCQSVPAFAAKSAPTIGQPTGQKELGGYGDQGEPTVVPVKTAEKGEPIASQNGNAGNSGACKRYFPNVGEMLPVPCTN